ncbi:MAG: SLC13 family permease [Bacteroidia bacterium]
MTYTLTQRIGLLLGPALFVLCLAFFHPADLSPTGVAVLGATLWIATWWITEAIPIEATSLLPCLLFPLTEALGLKATTQAYGHPMVFLYLGGFIIALSIERWNLHRRIALHVIARMGTDAPRLILGFMVATALLSMWISNTATALMMLPIGMAIVRQLATDRGEATDTASLATPFAKALLLGIAYAASIGGMATLIGTPPNLVFAAVVEDQLGIGISFMQWFIFGFPFAAALLLITWWVLTRVSFRLRSAATPGGQAAIAAQLRALGPMRIEERRVLAIFALTGIAWITRSFLLEKLLPGIDDTLIGLMGALLLFLIPARSEPGSRLMQWQHTLRLPWGILLLFGGGLAIAQGFETSGLATWIGGRLQLLDGVSLLLIILLVATLVNFLTEVTSNLATATMILPILAALATGMGVHPFSLMVPAILASSCAFMLPVATPPNAIVFGSELIGMRDMVRAGILLNLLSILLITAFVQALPWLWGISFGR